jgi:hypothetical protein
MSYEDARHILDISNTSNEVKRANELARSFKVGDKVFYYGELCEVAAVRELRPRKVDCNMSNISIMMPSGKKKAVTAKMLTKAE